MLLSMTLKSRAAAAVASVFNLQHKKSCVLSHRIAMLDFSYRPKCSRSNFDHLLVDVVLLKGTRVKHATPVLCEQESLDVMVCT